jgi:drug/metabolite transporter (DMT)-like permease
MTSDRTTRTGIALAAVTALVSGVAVYVNGFGVAAVGDATTYTTAKNLVAALVLVVVSAAATAWGRGSAPHTATRPAWGARLAVAVVGGSVPFVLFFEGLARADSVDAAFIHKTLVVWVALLAIPFLRERPGPRHLLAVALLVAGQVLLVGGVPAVAWGTGEAMIGVATLLWAVEFVVAKRALADVASHDLAAWRMAGGAVVLLGWLAVTGRLPALLAVDASGWAWVVGTGLLLSAYVGTWYAALARAPAVDVAAVLVAGAIVTALLQAGLDGADLASGVLGLGLLAAGAAVVAAGAASGAPARTASGASART